MNLSVIGTGYVGLVTGACFAEMGNTVTCVDTDTARVEALRAGQVPFFEPGLAELVAANGREGRLRFTGSHAEAVAGAQIHFIAVGTPPRPDGAADLSHVLDAARQIGRHARHDCAVVDKSTVPVGTADRVRAAIGEELARRAVSIRVDVVSNPEFLKEGDAINDFIMNGSPTCASASAWTWRTCGAGSGRIRASATRSSTPAAATADPAS